MCKKIIVGKKIMCKNISWKIRTRTSGEGVVLEIRTHPDRGGVVVRKPENLADVLCRRLRFVTSNSEGKFVNLTSSIFRRF